MRRVGTALLGATLIWLTTLATQAGPASADRPHSAVGGFPTAAGDAVAVAFADGSLRPNSFGDAFTVRAVNAANGLPLPPGDYTARLFSTSTSFPRPPPVAVRVETLPPE